MGNLFGPKHILYFYMEVLGCLLLAHEVWGYRLLGLKTYFGPSGAKGFGESCSRFSRTGVCFGVMCRCGLVFVELRALDWVVCHRPGHTCNNCPTRIAAMTTFGGHVEIQPCAAQEENYCSALSPCTS